MIPHVEPEDLDCQDCGGSGLHAGHGHRPHPRDTGDAHDCSSCPYPCETCRGTGLSPTEVDL